MPEYGPLASLNDPNRSGEISSTSKQDTLKTNSSLAAKNLKLEGHKDSITCAKFSPCGKYICSGSRDKSIFIWHGTESCQHIGVLDTKSPILDLEFSDTSHPSLLFTAQSTGLISIWDLQRGSQVRRLGNHHSRKHAHRQIVNSLSIPRSNNKNNNSSGNILYSCSDDKTIKKWDLRAKSPVATHQHTFEVTTICALSEDAVFFGGLDNQIYCWDSELAHIDYEISNQMRPNSHSEMIYSTALSPTKRYMLSVSADKSMKVWNVQPFLSKSLEQQGRCMAQFYSQFNSSDFDIFRASWSCDEKYVSCGGAKLLFIWNFQNKKLEYALPGHLGNVTCVDFSPNDPSVVLSAGTDGIIFVGELENN